MYYVYCYTNLVNGKKYFGKGCGKRADVHLKIGRSLVSKAIQKHGIDNFKVEFMFRDLTEADAFEIEKFYIRKFKTNVCREYEPGKVGHGYNQTDGGEGMLGKPASPETRQKLSKALKGRRPSLEARQKLSEANRRRRGTATSEARRKMSEAHKGRRKSPETRKKMSEAAKQRRHSPATRAKMSVSQVERHRRCSAALASTGVF